MFDPPKGSWQIVPFASCSSTDQFIEFLDRPSFLEFLRRFKSDFWVMQHLRNVITQAVPVSRMSDDEVIEAITWKVSVHQLAIRRDDLAREGGTGGGGSSGGGSSSSDQDQSSSSSSNQSSNTAPVPVSTSSGPKKSWFAITVVEELNGAEKVVENLTLHCELPDLGKTSGVISKRAPHLRYNDLNPGGTGDVLATSHDEIVWEVTADIY